MQPLYLKRIKTPIFMQMEIGDCGAAALGIILSYYQRYVSLGTLREQCLVARDGVSLANLAQAAQAFGMNATIHQKKLSAEVKLPVILFWNRRHYVVLEGIKGDKVYLNDPNQGHQVISWDKFNQQYSGIYIQFEVKAELIKDRPLRPWRHLLPILKKESRALLSFAVATILSSLLTLSPLIAVKLFIDFKKTNTAQTATTEILAVLLVVYIVQLMISNGSRKLFRILETRFASELSEVLMHHLMRVPMNFFAYRRAGELVYRMQGVDRLAGNPWLTLCSVSSAILQAGIAFLLLLIWAPLLSLVALGMVILHSFLGVYARKRWGDLASMTKAHLAELTVAIAQCVSMIAQIKAQCSEKIYYAKWQTLLNNYLKSSQSLSKKHQTIQGSSSLIFITGHLCMLSVGLMLVSRGRMTIGELLVCQLLFLSIHELFSQRNRLVSQSEQIRADLQRVDDMLDYSLECIAPTSSPKKQGQGKVQLIDVTFGYSREFKPILNRLHLTIDAGTEIAIIGKSGGGKSTLIHLLAGLYQPWSGEILIDDRPLASYSLQERARLIGVVSQQQFFYQATLRENLCLWGTYSDEEIMLAMRMACIEELVDRSMDGLNYLLTEGATNISGGQRQRLEIARTLLAISATKKKNNSRMRQLR